MPDLSLSERDVDMVMLALQYCADVATAQGRLDVSDVYRDTLDRIQMQQRPELDKELTEFLKGPE